MKQVYRMLLQIAVAVGALFVAGLWRLQLVIGSHVLFFSGSNILGPLVGFCLGSWSIVALFVIRRLLALSLLGSGLIGPFSTYIPTLCAALYWKKSFHRLTGLFLPIVCMIAFMMHPIGSQAKLYALYWLIPVCIYFLPRTSLFAKALAATFVQHAVGSILWLYFVSSTSELWYSLLPVVIVERLVFASGMVVVVKLIQACHVSLLKRNFKLASLFSFLPDRRIMAG